MVDIRRTGRDKGIVPFPLGARQGWGNECLGRAVARGIAGGIVNRVTQMVDAAGTTTYSYTAGGQLWTEDGPWSNDTVTNSYTYRMRTGLALQQPTGVWTNGFWYDYAKRLTNVTSPAGTFSYTLGGTVAGSPLPKKLLLPNTSYITNTYDNVARLTGTWLKNSTNGTLNSHAYTYNAGHQRTQQVFSAGSTYDYTHDAIGQLTVADSTTGSEDRGYTYDAAWNLNWRTNGGTGQSFSVNSQNELTSGLSGAAYFYHDDNGNLTHSNNVSGNPTLTCSYDDENQLVEMLYSDGIGEESFLESAGSGWRTVFTYDGRGRLRLRQDYEWSGSAWTLTAEHRYVYDGMRVIQTRQGNNTPYVSYTRGTDVSGTLEGAGGIGGLLGRSHLYSGGNWYLHHYYHADGNGNVTYLVNSSQGLAASYRYDPYGNTISSSGTLAFANVYRFSSKEIHWNSGFYYYGYRWYAPNLQRWPNCDPFGERGFEVLRRGRANVRGSDGPNLYTFVRNNPVTKLDPFGLSLWVCTSRAFGIIGVNHAYMWDDRKDIPDEERNCSMQSSSGKGDTHDRKVKDGPPPGLGDGFDVWYGDNGVSCERIPNSNGKEKKAIDCCRDNANNGIWFPGLNDCHNPLDKCLEKAGIPPGDIPPHRRFGKNRGVL